MSTSYKVIRKLSDEEKKILIEALENDEYNVIHDVTNITEEEIGHRAGGWKFSWNAMNSELAELSKKAIINLINDPEILVYDEYGEKQDKDEFLKMAFEWEPNGYDSISYHEDHPDENVWSLRDRQKKIIDFRHIDPSVFKYGWQYDFMMDGLRWSVF